MSEIDWDTMEIAESYDRTSKNQFRKGRLLTGMMKIHRGARVLDLGCGTGRMALEIAGMVGPAGQVHGIDPSSHRIAIAARKRDALAVQNVSFSVGRAEDLSTLADATFSHVCFCSSFHWVDNKPLALEETFRVLERGGKVGMTTMDKDYPSEMKVIVESIGKRYGLDLPYPDPHQQMKRVGGDELAAMLKCAGFEGVLISHIDTGWWHDSASDALMLTRSVDFQAELRRVPAVILQKVIVDISTEIEKRQSPNGVVMPSLTLFAIAVKP